MSENINNILISLIRIGLGDTGLRDSMIREGFDGAKVDWSRLLNIAYKQSVDAVVMDGIIKFSNKGLESFFDSPENEDVRYEWFGSIIECEELYAAYKNTVRDLLKYLDRGGAGRIMILKGLACAAAYPVPSHRTFGDIDIYSIDTAPSKVDGLLSSFDGYKPIESALDRHSHSSFKGTSVENHYFFTSLGRGHSRFLQMEEALHKEIPSCRQMNIEGVAAYAPSPTFNAMFLMWHMASHIKLDNLHIRHLCDWMTFLRKDSSAVDWDKVSAIWKTAKLERFAAAVNGLLIDKFGLDASLVPAFQRNARDEKRLLDFIFKTEPLETTGIEAVLKYWHRRWNFAVAGDNFLAALLGSVIGHLKP